MYFQFSYKRKKSLNVACPQCLVLNVAVLNTACPQCPISYVAYVALKGRAPAL